MSNSGTFENLEILEAGLNAFCIVRGTRGYLRVGMLLFGYEMSPMFMSCPHMEVILSDDRITKELPYQQVSPWMHS